MCYCLLEALKLSMPLKNHGSIIGPKEKSLFLTLANIIRMKITTKLKREKVLISLRGENSSQVLIASLWTYKIRLLLSIFLIELCNTKPEHVMNHNTQRLFTFSLSRNTNGKSLCSIAVNHMRIIADVGSDRGRKMTKSTTDCE